MSFTAMSSNGPLLRADQNALQVETYNATGVTYTAINQTQYNTMRSVFARVLLGDYRVQGELNSVGFNGGPYIMPNGERLFVIKESTRSGKGGYAFRRSGFIPGLVCMVNHRTDDLYTGPIFGNIFAAHAQFQAIGWNTVPRAVYDVTDIAVAVPTAFAAAVADSYANGVFVEPHGYVQGSRTSTRGQTSEWILTAGVSPPPTFITDLKTALTAQGFTDIYRYNSTESGATDYVTELGGTLNEQGIAIRAINSTTRFCHIEICRPVRDDLQANVATRTKLVNALLTLAPAV